MFPQFFAPETPLRPGISPLTAWRKMKKNIGTIATMRMANLTTKGLSLVGRNRPRLAAKARRLELVSLELRREPNLSGRTFCSCFDVSSRDFGFLSSTPPDVQIWMISIHLHVHCHGQSAVACCVIALGKNGFFFRTWSLYVQYIDARFPGCGALRDTGDSRRSFCMSFLFVVMGKNTVGSCVRPSHSGIGGVFRPYIFLTFDLSCIYCVLRYVAFLLIDSLF